SLLNYLATSMIYTLSLHDALPIYIVDPEKYGIKITPRENILKIKSRALSFIDNIDNPEEKNLFFSGPTGVGKTFMINCIAKELLDRKSTRLNSSHVKISYAVFCLK